MSVSLFGLTSFQRDVLYVTMGLRRPSGQEPKDELESGTAEITRGRLYPNLDTLVKKDYPEKGDNRQALELLRYFTEGGQKL